MVRRSGNEFHGVIHNKEVCVPVTTVEDEAQDNKVSLFDMTPETRMYADEIERLQCTLNILLTMVALLNRDYDPGSDWLAASEKILALPLDLSLAEYLLSCIQQIVPCRGMLLAERDPTTNWLHFVCASGALLEEEYGLSSDDSICLRTLLQDPGLYHRLQAGKILSVSSIGCLPVGYHIVLPLLYQQQFIGIVLIAYSHVRYVCTNGNHVLLQIVRRLSTLLLQLQCSLREKACLFDDAHSPDAQSVWVLCQKPCSMRDIRHTIYDVMMEIRNCGEILYMNLSNCNDGVTSGNNIHADAHRVLHVIQAMVDLAWLEQGCLQPRWEWINVNTVIVDTAFQRYMITTRSRIRFHLVQALPLIVGDRDKLMQALTILLRIALQCSDTDDVVVSSWMKHPLLHIRIQISAGALFPILPHLYDADLADHNGQLHGQDEETLLMAREIIQLHGGQLWMDCSSNHDIAWHFTLQPSRERLEQKNSCQPIDVTAPLLIASQER